MKTESVSMPPANRLAREKSPYLLQHRHNPVDWYPWGQEAFDRARQEDKPIFLSIGYSTCHWCHVMERESFEDRQVATFLNRHFVSIKVDREERPDVDHLYMAFVQATTGQGGWPLNVFLTPEREPFFGGTYFPPTRRQGRPGLLELLEQLRDLWGTRRTDIAQSASQISAGLGQALHGGGSADAPATTETLRRAGLLFQRTFDPRHGGFGGAPKFPQPSVPQFLLRYARRFHEDDARRMVLRTCERMAAGGIHDQLGGGFARYAVDAAWLVPHFEKMLYDNAQLAQLYLDAYLVSADQRFLHTARGILDYVLRDLTHPEGGFYSAEDADSEGHEGKFYCWTLAELSQLLAPEEREAAIRYFGITASGNFIDHSHPQPLPHQNVLSVVEPTLAPGEQAALEEARRKMLEARSRRVRPHLDDKVLASWNGLMLAALAQACAVLGGPAYRSAAERNLAFLQSRLWDSATGTIYHRWRDGEHDHAQLLDAYAFLLAGTLALYQATLHPPHLEFAVALADSILAKFHDPDHGGFWQSASPAPDLIIRAKQDYDGAVPSGNSVAIFALLQLGHITGRRDFLDAAGKGLQGMAGRLAQAPHAVPYLLQALDFALAEPKRVVIAGDPACQETRALLAAVHSVYQPNKIVLGTTGPVEPLARRLPAAPAAVYVCSGNACLPPVSDPRQAAELVAE